MENLEKENYRLKEEIKKLKREISQEIEKNHKNDKVLFKQSKMASLGEMLGNIAHQWRQPLMELSSVTMELQAKIELLGKVTNEEIIESIEKSNDIIQYMSQTIDDFRNFFAKDKKRVQFKITEQISSAINMINSSLKQHNIKLEIIVIKNSSIIGFKNEYSQVLINILSNAKDELVNRKIKDPKITLKIGEKEGKSIVEIEDNAGGIKIEPIDKVFEPFYTKDKANGTGVGLFMSKLIVENNMDGRLLVKNSSKGAKFIIVIPKSF
ncbi:sensor histidine kinase [Halarcobacter anaerophilus]|uniref:histidine kinase n=1 Tax=Halarcobacter anaerophilus TaxID=877500 RepID=A0A4Q0Y4H1_9BACT|nr:HAMP domain-containing sensor histidine kinase [Halarcobacter anaerophilus]QDF30148.1 two-component system sensor histidine kinase [Halarcobacter anaerophilus]RXJ63191.1 histidine kinase [Halarcobacter anaerophilus]